MFHSTVYRAYIMHYEPSSYHDGRCFGSPFGPNALIRNPNAANLKSKKCSFSDSCFS